MSSLRDAQAHEVAFFGMISARDRIYNITRQIVFFARHGRQSITELKAMRYSEFHRFKRALNELVEREWEPDPAG